MTQKRSQIFVSYSHADSDHLHRLKVHLRPFERQSLVNVWSDTKIKTGQHWKKEIQNALDRAAVAILLISADFLASDFVVDSELPPLLDAAQAEGIKILPIILKPCAFTSIDSLSKFQAVNNPDEPMISLEEAQREQHWLKLAKTAKESLVEFEKKSLEIEGGIGIQQKPFIEYCESVTALLINEEIDNPNCISDYHVYTYHHIDVLEYMPSAEAVLQGAPNAGDILSAVKKKFKKSGWEGDGELQIMWIPPFVGAGFEDTYGLAVWFVKQSNNGTAFMASPVPLPFSRLLEQQY